MASLWDTYWYIKHTADMSSTVTHVSANIDRKKIMTQSQPIPSAVILQPFLLFVRFLFGKHILRAFSYPIKIGIITKQ